MAIALLARLLEDGHLVCGREMPQVVEALRGTGFRLSRNVLIGPCERGPDLLPMQGDFWFHTDGVFLDPPPRWIAVEVIHQDAGGALQVLDSRHVGRDADDDIYRFGNADLHIERRVRETLPQGRVFRYRRDYMRPLDPASAARADIVHRAVEASASDHRIDLGELRAGQCLFVDNWRMLHRRLPFAGDRTIRRLWFDYA